MRTKGRLSYTFVRNSNSSINCSGHSMTHNQTISRDLRKAGLKVTLPRLNILEILEGAEQHHMSAEDVYKALLKQGSDVGLATVYRVLTQFEAAGLVTRHHFDGGQAIFELDTGDNHDHIVCVKSGKVSEFKDELIEQRLHEIARELGYTLTDHKIILYGVYQGDDEAESSIS